MDDVVELGHALDPPHPEAAEDQAAAVDEGHPERKRLADIEEADQRQRGDDDADRDGRGAEPQARYSKPLIPPRTGLRGRLFAAPAIGYTNRDTPAEANL
jgi:hypothetical protein